MGYVYVALTVVFTVYGQIVLKWRMNLKGSLPEPLKEKVLFLFTSLLDPWLLSGLFVAFLASLAWMATVTKLDLSHAYPFMSSAFVLVLILSSVFFSEAITLTKVFGMVLIVAGIVVSSQG
jgi:multidrug transporter EmrE-like cation transporter